MIDLTKILTEDMRGKWIALNEDSTKVIAYHDSLLELDKIVEGEKVIYMKYPVHNVCEFKMK